MANEATIPDAKELAYRLRKAGVAIFTLSGGRFGFASYGMTARQCKQLGKLCDRMMELVQSGEVDLSAFR